MKKKKTETLESFFTTENEHWNGFAYALHCKTIEKGLFEKPEELVPLVSNSINLLDELAETPTKAVEQLLKEIYGFGLSAAQQLFVYDGIIDYLSKTKFDKDLNPVQNLLESHVKQTRIANKPVKPLVQNIREQLKELVQTELKTLPDTLKDLEPEKRSSILCKLMPFVLPKVESIPPEKGEPGQWEI